MAKNKSKSNSALLNHINTYVIGLWLMGILNLKYFSGFWWICVFVGINYVAHLLTDWVTSRASSALYKEERYHDFFVVIGADQMIHYITLFGTFIWLSSL